MYKKNLKIIHYRWHDVNYSIVFFKCLKMYIKGVPRKKKFLSVITKVPLSFSLPLCLSSSAMYRVSFSNKGLVNFCPSQERHELQKSSDKIIF